MANNISLLNVVKYYSDQPHQQEAIAYLQDNIPNEVLKEFTKIWRTPKVKPIENKIGDRLKALKIKLDKGINIIGLEGCNYDYTRNSDEFWNDAYNDLILVCYAEEEGYEFKILGKYIGTTEPGVFWTTSVNRNKLGAARVAIDTKQQDIWMLGKHKTQYPALVQIGNKVKVVRDFNKDGFRTGDKEYEGYFGKV